MGLFVFKTSKQDEMMIKKIQKVAKKYKLSALSLMACVPTTSFAAGSSPETILQSIIDYLTGDIARLTGILVLVCAGYLFLITQSIEKKTFVNIVIGMGLIYGGAALADLWWG